MEQMQDVLDAALTNEDKETIKAVLAKLYPLFEENKIPADVIAKLGALVGYPAPSTYPQPYPQPHPYPYPYPQAKEIQKLLENIPNREEVETVLAKALESVEETRKKDLEALAKAQEELAELRKALEAERDARERTELMAQLKAKFPKLSELQPEWLDIAVSLRKSDMFEKIMSSLERAEALFAQAPVMKEIGERAPEAKSPMDTLDERARELVSKGLARTLEQARVKVLQSDPELYRMLRGGE